MTDVGGVPEGWQLHNLGTVASFVNGKAHENSISPEGSYVVVNSKFVSSEGKVVKYSDFCLCPADQEDILIVMSDVPNGRAIGKCFYVDNDDAYTVNQRIGLLKATKVNPKILFYSLNRNPYFLSFDDGIKQTNLRKDEVLSCPILMPVEQGEQRKIADILSAWDEAIEQQTRLLDLKRERKRGLMPQLMTGKVRFKEFEGLEWKNVSLGDVLFESRLLGVDELGKRLTVALHLKGVSARDERGTSEVGKTVYFTRQEYRHLHEARQEHIEL